jgi:transcriptional regulator with XRE-family HTH domain
MAPRATPIALLRRLGARIRLLRKEAGLSQEELAWECDLERTYLSNVETGKRAPSVATLFLIADRLGLEAADLVALNLRVPRLAVLDEGRRAAATNASGKRRKLHP